MKKETSKKKPNLIIASPSNFCINIKNIGFDTALNPGFEIKDPNAIQALRSLIVNSADRLVDPESTASLVYWTILSLLKDVHSEYDKLFPDEIDIKEKIKTLFYIEKKKESKEEKKIESKEM